MALSREMDAVATIASSALEAPLSSQSGLPGGAHADGEASPPNDPVTQDRGADVDRAEPLGSDRGGLARAQLSNAAATVEWRNDVIALLPALRAFAGSLSRNSADADDLVQDTLIKAWTHQDKFERGTNLRAWLFTILRNTYYTAVVKRRREVADEDGKHAARLSAAPTQDWSVAMRAMQAALQQLPAEHREALILVGAAGLTYEEAAEICGCALGTIKSRVNRARARLLRIMDADDATDALVGVIDPPQP